VTERPRSGGAALFREGSLLRLDAALARLPLASLPTPLEPAPRLGDALGLDLLVKREDLSGLGQGGNKARQIEVLLAAADADTIITTAGSQSNFCRTLAAGCARAGLRCVLLLRQDGRERPTGNLLLDRVFGAEVRWIDTTDPYDESIEARLAALAGEVRAGGRRPHVIRLTGAAGPLAAAAAVGLAEELVTAWATTPQAVYVPAGSGLTAAGLALGLQALGQRVPVVAVSVQQPEGFIRPLILRRMREAAGLLGLEVALDDDLLVVDDHFIGEGYGIPSAGSLDAVAAAGRLEGFVLDPAYGGKALAALMAHVGRLDPHRPVVFVHTGGAPGLFAEAGSVMRHLGV
jgi:1-aminocyclopropane-1-carboxylate deaminase/D-cysteine desulfhydrase-like pyridoxal-dependent ACC family enzyme